MLKALLLLLIVSIASHEATVLPPRPSASYQHNSVLAPDEFALYWNVTDDSKLVLEIHSKLEKWIGFGFSLMDDQKDLDVFVAWSDGDGTGHFSDRHRKNGGDLLVDKRQSWFIDDIELTNDYMIMKVHRNVKVCDPDSEDIDIKQGIMNVVYSSGLLFDEDHLKPWNMKPIDVLKGASEGQCEAEPEPVVYEFKPTAYYSNFVDLIDGIYRFYWNFTDTDITGEIHCKTSGWVGFGLTPNGKMDKSDVVVGWITSDGKVNFTDRHIDDRSVMIDNSQDWHLLESKEENGFTIFKFTRKILSCDPDDRHIEKGSPHLIYAFGITDPQPDKDISYHGAQNRGTRQAVLISGATNKEQVLEGIETMDFLVENAILPSDDTTYYCQLMTVPDSFVEKRHIVQWELLMPKMNQDKIHHVLVYECPLNVNLTTYPNGYCFSNPVRWQCNVISFGWAVGAELTHFFPEDTGYPIGGDTNYKNFYVEVHYDNPESKLGYIDSMGLRFHMTKQLRKNELGILTLGTGTDEYSIAIPPGVDKFEFTSHCYQHCTEQLPQNITVIMATPHTHLAGIGLHTKIIRDGYDIGYLHQNKYYDFNFQNVYRLDPPVVVKPGDELITKCLYQTKDRKAFTFGGEPTYREMCYYFYTYYPRIPNFSNCMSVFTRNSLTKLVRELAEENYLEISESISSSDDYTLWEGFRQLKQKTSAPPEVISAYDRFLNYTQFNAFCNMKFYNEPRDAIVPLNSFVEEDVCKDVTPAPSTTTTTKANQQTSTTRTQATTSGSAKSFASSFMLILAVGVLHRFL